MVKYNSMRDVELSTGTTYHVFNHGVGNKPIFKNTEDYSRFADNMQLFNDAHYKRGRSDVPSRWRKIGRADGVVRQPFVRVISYVLMPDHFHMMLEQLRDNGISDYLHRLQMGYAKYANLKYKKRGHVFESTFKTVAEDFDEQLEHLPRYIHLNALDLSGLPWRSGQVTDWNTAEKFLNNYRWSSHHVYLGETQEVPIVDEGYIKSLFPDPELYLAYLRNWSERNRYHH